MNSNLQPKVDSSHQISLDLDGLDELLEVTAEVTEVLETEVPHSEELESQKMLLKLMGQIVTVNESVQEAKERLGSANERMNSLAAVIQTQTGQLELLSHYQNQAARVNILERHNAELQAEVERLKRRWFNKVLAMFKR